MIFVRKEANTTDLLNVSNGLSFPRCGRGRLVVKGEAVASRTPQISIRVPASGWSGVFLTATGCRGDVR
ncbi:hypothetical protein TNCV_1232951 [Trichonephila clavipes]|nr:hypothetical protein TNCV_1232951 [Trichonephila clavipes]